MYGTVASIVQSQNLSRPVIQPGFQLTLLRRPALTTRRFLYYPTLPTLSPSPALCWDLLLLSCLPSACRPLLEINQLLRPFFTFFRCICLEQPWSSKREKEKPNEQRSTSTVDLKGYMRLLNINVVITAFY